MELRRVVAYGLIALLALVFAGLAAWGRYHSYERTLARRRLRERGDGERRTAEQDARKS